MDHFGDPDMVDCIHPSLNSLLLWGSTNKKNNQALKEQNTKHSLVRDALARDITILGAKHRAPLHPVWLPPIVPFAYDIIDTRWEPHGSIQLVPAPVQNLPIRDIYSFDVARNGEVAMSCRFRHDLRGISVVDKYNRQLAYYYSQDQGYIVYYNDMDQLSFTPVFNHVIWPQYSIVGNTIVHTNVIAAPLPNTTCHGHSKTDHASCIYGQTMNGTASTVYFRDGRTLTIPHRSFLCLNNNGIFTKHKDAKMVTLVSATGTTHLTLQITQGISRA